MVCIISILSLSHIESFYIVGPHVKPWPFWNKKYGGWQPAKITGISSSWQTCPAKAQVLRMGIVRTYTARNSKIVFFPDSFGVTYSYYTPPELEAKAKALEEENRRKVEQEQEKRQQQQAILGKGKGANSRPKLSFGIGVKKWEMDVPRDRTGFEQRNHVDVALQQPFLSKNSGWSGWICFLACLDCTFVCVWITLL